MFITDVNTACINKLFSAGKWRMHSSMSRLLNCAREATRGQRGAITDFKDLGARLGESSAVITNWKSRGISKAGALKAARIFGCSATWLIDGKGDSGSLHAPQETRLEADEFGGALEVIAKALAEVDTDTRESVAQWLSKLALDPSKLSITSQRLRALLNTPVAAPATSHDGGNGQRLPDLPRGIGPENGTSHSVAPAQRSRQK